MKKNYSFEKTNLLPKKSTIDFLLQFSKSMSVVRVKKLEFVVVKN